MSASSLPRLTEKKIRTLATEQSFDRGDRYYRQLRQTYARLPAFQDELNRAKL